MVAKKGSKAAKNEGGASNTRTSTKESSAYDIVLYRLGIDMHSIPTTAFSPKDVHDSLGADLDENLTYRSPRRSTSRASD
jgi:hypothetical protein